LKEGCDESTPAAEAEAEAEEEDGGGGGKEEEGTATAVAVAMLEGSEPSSGGSMANTGS
jgi:hypothetical protein